MIANWTYDLERFFPTHENFQANFATPEDQIVIDKRHFELPLYPEEGCMKVIDGVLFVRLS